jgi:hypothetical protein
MADNTLPGVEPFETHHCRRFVVWGYGATGIGIYNGTAGLRSV